MSFLEKIYLNLDLIMEVFKDLFKNDNQVQLKIIVPPNYRFNYKNEYSNNVLSKMYDNSIEHFELSHNNFLNKLMNQYKDVKNIIFLKGNYSDEDCIAEVFKSDCYIDICSTKHIHPLILESIAFGKKNIVIDDNMYEEYLPEHSSYKVKYEKKICVIRI